MTAARPEIDCEQLHANGVDHDVYARKRSVEPDDTSNA